MTDSITTNVATYPHCATPNSPPPSEKEAEREAIRKIIGTYSGKLTPASDTNPICIPIKSDPIKFTPNVNPAQLTDYSRKVLEEILVKANIRSVTITSIVRTAHDQARAMFNNLSGKGKAKGLPAQRKSYKEMGNQIIDVYETMTQDKSELEVQNLSTEIITAMQKKIEEIGVEKVTHHALDPKICNVFDVGPRSMSHISAMRFEVEVRTDKRVKKFLTPGQYDPAYHIEIEQPI